MTFWQLHDVGTLFDVNEIFAKGGAMEALLEMKEQKVVRHLGLTGHYRPDALMEGIRRYSFDTVLMAMSAADPHYYSFGNEGAAAAGGGTADGDYRDERFRGAVGCCRIGRRSHWMCRRTCGKEWFLRRGRGR